MRYLVLSLVGIFDILFCFVYAPLVGRVLFPIYRSWGMAEDRERFILAMRWLLGVGGSLIMAIVIIGFAT
jgi:hypothetical protein